MRDPCLSAERLFTRQAVVIKLCTHILFIKKKTIDIIFHFFLITFICTNKKNSAT